MGTKQTKNLRSLGRDIKKSLSHDKTGLYFAIKGTHGPGSFPTILRVFGCQKCSWIGTLNCPHGKKLGEHHANWICSQKREYIRQQLDMMGSMPRIIQNEEAVKLKLLADQMLFEYSETGDLNEEYKHISKNLISLIDKMRKQDEGLKIQGELTVAHEDFKKLVETEAKRIEERNNRTRPAEFSEEVRDSGQQV